MGLYCTFISHCPMLQIGCHPHCPILHTALPPPLPYTAHFALYCTQRYHPHCPILHILPYTAHSALNVSRIQSDICSLSTDLYTLILPDLTFTIVIVYSIV